MFKNKRQPFAFFAVTAILGFSIAPASATLLIQELFDGIANTSAPNTSTNTALNGLGDSNASLGFLGGSTWAVNSGSMTAANNFDAGYVYPSVDTYPGTNNLPIGLPGTESSKGGLWNSAGNWSTNIYATRELATSIDFSLDQTIYFSVRLDNSGNSAPGIGLANGANGSASFVSAGFTWDNATSIGGASFDANNSTYIGYGTLDTESGPYGIRTFDSKNSINTYGLLVGRITISSTGSDLIEVKTYKSGDTIDDNLDTIVWGASATFDASGLYSYLLITNNGSGTGQVDAIRFGTEWVDVTGVTAVPEPSSVAFFMVGGLGLLLVTKKYRRI